MARVSGQVPDRTDVGPRPPDRRIPDERLPAPGSLVEEWADALVGVERAAAGRPDLVRHLTSAVEHLAVVLGSEQFGAAPAERVGRDLVSAYRIDPAALARSLDLLGARWIERTSGVAEVRRVTRTLGAVAAGYARAVGQQARIEDDRAARSMLDRCAVADQARRTSDARFSAVFTTTPTGIVIADPDGRVVEANQVLCRMLGRCAEDLAGSPIRHLVQPDDEPDGGARIDRMTSGTLDRFGAQRSFTRPGGRHVWTDVDVSLVRDEDGTPTHVVATFVDVSERRRLQATLRHQAEHDPLTGLPNRALLVARLKTALRATHPTAFGLCYLDLDRFRTVNEAHGHGVGDRLLQAVAARLNGLVEPSRGRVARVGGDAFALLVWAGPDEVCTLGRSTVQRLREPFLVDGRTIRVSASVGVVARAQRCADAAELMTAADSALLWAKGDGRDRSVVFDRGRYRRDARRTDLAARLVGAVGRREFVVEYQPLVRLGDRRLAGLEALVRWERPGESRLGPESFIALAEQTGVIVELGADVLRTACADARAWVDAHPGHDLLLSVNISARQLEHPDAVGTVTRILGETGWPARRLQLELVERDVLTGHGASAERLGLLAAAGVRIAIDDFGTGYSNLEYLRTLPLHSLKIAGTFVTGSTPDDPALLGAIVDLAHSLGLDVVAESVETGEQAGLLTELGCDVGQGWYFGRPAPITAIDPGPAPGADDMPHTGPSHPRGGEWEKMPE